MRCLALSLAVVMLFASAARAQTLRPEVLTPDERNAVALTLRLLPAEIAILDELAISANAERAHIVQEQREKVTAIWKEQTDAVRRGETPDMEAAMASIAHAQALLDEVQTRMIEDLVLGLPDDRSHLLESCVLRLERMRALARFGDNLSGLTADPLTVAHALAVPEILDADYVERFDRAMLAYDRALAERLVEFREIQDDAAKTFSQPGFQDNGPEAVEFFEKSIRFIHDIQRTHRERASAIANTLPIELRDGWRTEWRRQSFPTVFRPHFVETAMGMLLPHPALTESERDALAALNDRLERELAHARDDACDAIEEAEQSLTAEAAMAANAIISSDIESTRAALDELAASARRRIIDALAPERHELVPPLRDPQTRAPRTPEELEP